MIVSPLQIIYDELKLIIYYFRLGLTYPTHGDVRLSFPRNGNGFVLSFEKSSKLV